MFNAIEDVLVQPVVADGAVVTLDVAVLADKAFDADERVIKPLEAAGKKIVIPSKSNRKNPRAYDEDMYKTRHLIENFFARIKQFRAIATRYDKTARNFLAAVIKAGIAHLWFVTTLALSDGVSIIQPERFKINPTRYIVGLNT